MDWKYKKKKRSPAPQYYYSRPVSQTSVATYYFHDPAISVHFVTYAITFFQ